MRRRLFLGVLALGMAVAACGSGDADIVTYTDSNKLTLVKVPAQWNVYPFEEVSTLDKLPFAEPYQQLQYQATSVIAFDAGPSRSVTNVTTPLATATFPIGSMSIRSVNGTEKEFLSRATLSQTLLPYFQLQSQEHVKEDFTFGDGFDGIRVLVSFADATGANVGVAYLISVTDDADQRIYSILVGCNRDCFIQNQPLIEQVVDSWLVNKRA
jgi:hypothetical protein